MEKCACAANYYTKVLGDFSNGWKDKKGDKSPLYLVYYNVAHANNKDDSILLKSPRKTARGNKLMF